MNYLELVFKQMRQRGLSTTLNILAVLLGMGLVIAITIVTNAGESLFAQSDFGFDIIIGPPKGSGLQLTLNTVYHIDKSPGNIPYSLYEDLARKSDPPPGRVDFRSYVKLAIPFMVGDSFQGRRIVGTSPEMFGVDDKGQPVKGTPFQYRKDMAYELSEGRVFGARKFEAIIGSEVAKQLHLHLYDPSKTEDENLAGGGAFRATHGFPGPHEKPDIHKPRWHIVGILKPTHTASDRVLFIPFISLYAIAEHESGMIDQMLAKANIDPSRIPPDRLDEVLAKLGFDPANVPASVKAKYRKQYEALNKDAAKLKLPVEDLLHDATVQPATQSAEEEGEDPDAYHLDENKDIIPDLPPEDWELSAVLVRSRGGFQMSQLVYNFTVIDNRATAVEPAQVMHDFFKTFLSNMTTVLLLISALVTVVAAASIMTTIYNSVAARRREIAILRALGATRVRILTLICLEATLIGLIGGVLGFLAGHLLSAAGSAFLQQQIGEGFDWFAVSGSEFLSLAGVVVLSFLAGLVPGLKAYSTPVASSLVAT